MYRLGLRKKEETERIMDTKALEDCGKSTEDPTRKKT